MRYTKVSIAAVGYELPPNVVRSDEIEERLSPLYERLKLPKGRLQMMTGIKERRFWGEGEKPSSSAVKAGAKAILASGIDVDKFGALFHTSVCRDFLEPATANVVHSGLKLSPNALIFDISNACLGVLDGMVTLANMIELDQVEAGIIVAGEMGEALVESTINDLLSNKSHTRQSIKPAFASLTIGSGAAAVVLAKSDLAPGGMRLAGGVARCATKDAHLCKSSVDQGVGQGSAPLMATDSEELLKAGCALAGETWDEFKKTMGWENNDINRAFTHQVGAAHRRLLYESIGLNTEIDFATVSYLGNIGSVSLPITLGIGLEKGLVKRGDKVALLGIGSGLNCMMLGLESL
ncbi:3-oxoacyl-[ACP] synthase III in alkane synthesis cluster [hydrothermal vent metagenome]|uniref:3-oxoacyl-[ACP] synthase III in alkane synthesis cluster n=1 Tax=hydrothermal vent metagenome TaxID=652676 RepID=A0A3B1C463_9ZZZZ